MQVLAFVVVDLLVCVASAGVMAACLFIRPNALLFLAGRIIKTTNKGTSLRQTDRQIAIESGCGYIS